VDARRSRSAGRSASTATARVGCSGWNYKSWRGRFYAPTLPASKWLAYYATVFDTVEVNNTFYRLPEASTFAAWARQTPSAFLMAVKASRFLTHMPIARLFSRASALGRHLGPVLYQLPGNFPIDLPRLEQFLIALPARVKGVRVQHVFEFRHPSWYVGEVFDLLTRHRATLCLHDKTGSTIADPFVGPSVYVRFHGTSGHYHGSYSTPALDRWAHRLVEQLQEGRPVYAYFNNDPEAVATANARTLRERIEALQETGRSRRVTRSAPAARSASAASVYR
jgi:uncharacterized protein YecE (DUF72 family)